MRLRRRDERVRSPQRAPRGAHGAPSVEKGTGASHGVPPSSRRLSRRATVVRRGRRRVRNGGRADAVASSSLERLPRHGTGGQRGRRLPGDFGARRATSSPSSRLRRCLDLSHRYEEMPPRGAGTCHGGWKRCRSRGKRRCGHRNPDEGDHHPRREGVQGHRKGIPASKVRYSSHGFRGGCGFWICKGQAGYAQKDYGTELGEGGGGGGHHGASRV
mmetsp:Transcript_26915/g.61959  ORF Transcript_26915/g.61959 Transcript_26915/m.61959 type:complete len:216 (+) Transcript_26915:1273-1920(+)